MIKRNINNINNNWFGIWLYRFMVITGNGKTKYQIIENHYMVEWKYIGNKFII